VPVFGAPHKPAAALPVAAFSETGGTALRASHPGGSWLESTAAHNGQTASTRSGREGRHRSAGAPSTDTPSTWCAPGARLMEGAAAQPPGDVPGLTTNKMNSVKTSPST